MKISFHSHANETKFSYEKISTRTRFIKEAKSNSEMTYGRLSEPKRRGSNFEPRPLDQLTNRHVNEMSITLQVHLPVTGRASSKTF